MRSWIALLLLLVIGSQATGTTEVTVWPLVGPAEDAVYQHAVLAAIHDARDSIDLMLSSVSIDGNPLLPALAEAASRGVTVRAMVDESSWAPEITARNRPALLYLLEHGIDARFDDPDITLHAKLVIVDRETVILGSSNWNRRAFTEHRQSDVLVTSRTIAAFYHQYFEIVWNGGMTDHTVELDEPSSWSSGSAIVPLADLPDAASYAAVVLSLLDEARQSIRVAMYRMSYYTGYADSLGNQLVDSLIAAAHRGLDVKVLIDDNAFFPASAQANLQSAIRLAQHGVEVRLDAADVTTHTKMVVIDGHCVVLGSTNWNYYALERNCEVAIAFINLPDIASPFERFFHQLWAEGRDLSW